jgi:hypothetical protein
MPIKLLAAGLALASAHAFASNSFYTGNQLYERLTTNREFAKGYIIGVVDTMDEHRHPDYGFKFCLPRNTALGQTVDVVEIFLRNAPQKRHMSADSLVMSALHEAFPCKK